jgi:hypothetical protein
MRQIRRPDDYEHMKRYIALVPFIVTLGLAARPAEAAYDYCGGLVSAKSWCWTGYLGDAGLITWNRAQYPGSGTVNVGISLYRNFTRTYHDTHYANNYVASSNLGLRGQAGVGNNSDSRHTINGAYRFCWGCSLARVSPESLSAPAEVIGPVIDQLAVLRRPATPDDVLSNFAVEAILDGNFDVDAVSARRVNLLGRTDAFFVAPGSNVCMFREAGDSRVATCAPAEAVANGDLFVVSAGTDDLAPGMVRVSGVAPDGVVAVNVALVEGGPIVRVPVTDNVYVVELQGEATQRPAVLAFEYDEAAETTPEPEVGGCQATRSRSGLGMLAFIGLAMLWSRRRRAVR